MDITMICQNSYWISHKYFSCICQSQFPLNSVFSETPCRSDHFTKSCLYQTLLLLLCEALLKNKFPTTTLFMFPPDGISISLFHLEFCQITEFSGEINMVMGSEGTNTNKTFPCLCNWNHWNHLKLCKSQLKSVSFGRFNKTFEPLEQFP